MVDRETSYSHALLAGGMAGLSVDMALFPLDTIKTRLQSQQGFFKAGGFRGIYAGLPSAAIGSVPGAALFFMTYETVKQAANSKTPTHLQPIVHMVAASAGEVCACVVRVPCEVVKQRAQAAPHLSTLFVLRKTLSQEGVRGLYRGYFSTVFREIPFSLIQFPLWEFLKTSWSSHQGHRIEAWQSSVCGAISGGISAALTTPLDVAKTRIMLAETGTSVAQGSIPYALRVVWSEKGIRGLFAGVVPRVMWISIGGAIFLGVYDKIKNLLEKLDSKS